MCGWYIWWNRRYRLTDKWLIVLLWKSNKNITDIFNYLFVISFILNHSMNFSFSFCVYVSSSLIHLLIRPLFHLILLHHVAVYSTQELRIFSKKMQNPFHHHLLISYWLFSCFFYHLNSIIEISIFFYDVPVHYFPGKQDNIWRLPLRWLNIHNLSCFFQCSPYSFQYYIYF